MDFGHKHVETGPSCSHELIIFLKYHMSLRLLKLNFSINEISQECKQFVVSMPAFKS